jgi:hypothetical protein
MSVETHVIRAGARRVVEYVEHALNAQTCLPSVITAGSVTDAANMLYVVVLH